MVRAKKKGTTEEGRVNRTLVCRALRYDKNSVYMRRAAYDRFICSLHFRGMCLGDDAARRKEEEEKSKGKSGLLAEVGRDSERAPAERGRETAGGGGEHR